MRKLIYYVDDDEDDISLLKEAFKSIDTHELRCVMDGIHLFKELSLIQKDVCLVILDINMPVINGVQVLLDMKSIPGFNKIPVVMLTTSQDSKEHKMVKDLGVDIIQKPSSYMEIRTLAHRLLDYCD